MGNPSLRLSEVLFILGNYIASYSIFINLLMSILNGAIGTAYENSVKFCGIYFDNATLTLHNVTLTSQKTYKHNNKNYCSKKNGYK